MKLKFFRSVLIVGITGLTTLVTLIVRISPILSQASSSANPDKVTFSCRETFDKASGEYIPATVAWNPERRGSVRFIGWITDPFNHGWNPQKRCKKVSEKFQQMYSQGSLNYLSHGMHNGLPIICGLAEKGETCNGSNQLFTIKPTANSGLVLQSLMDITQRTAGNLTILVGPEGTQTYVPVENFLKQAPLMKQGN